MYLDQREIDILSEYLILLGFKNFNEVKKQRNKITHLTIGGPDSIPNENPKFYIPLSKCDDLLIIEYSQVGFSGILSLEIYGVTESYDYGYVNSMCDVDINSGFDIFLDYLSKAEYKYLRDYIISFKREDKINNIIC
jgi:hypothetical protein